MPIREGGLFSVLYADWLSYRVIFGPSRVLLKATLMAVWHILSVLPHLHAGASYPPLSYKAKIH